PDRRSRIVRGLTALSLCASMAITPRVRAQTTSSPSTGPTVKGKAISLPSSEGSVHGLDESFSAQPSTGIATYQLTFEIPAARGDAQPSLGLSYSSTAGDGVAGLGWSLDLASIARKTDNGAPKYQNFTGFDPDQDRFVYGSEDLVPICVVGAAPGLQCPN